MKPKEQGARKIIHIRKSGEQTESMKGVKAPEQTNRILKEAKGETDGRYTDTADENPRGLKERL